ncbi:hypothetical protein JYU34_020030 [Plutella xylostella]|uniref:Uncharacterized protein n=1 Tax=Plutella xylostella TaxID=51655 RepID=A0ABQ7PVS9_PLUXY|nr:hypothetical protein JYU34_020030 [Plutella xylostella]
MYQKIRTRNLHRTSCVSVDFQHGKEGLYRASRLPYSISEQIPHPPPMYGGLRETCRGL